MKEYVYAYFSVKGRAGNGDQSNTLLGSRNGFWRAVSTHRRHKRDRNVSESCALLSSTFGQQWISQRV